jgi:hypothetical protein
LGCDAWMLYTYAYTYIWFQNKFRSQFFDFKQNLSNNIDLYECVCVCLCVCVVRVCVCVSWNRCTEVAKNPVKIVLWGGWRVRRLLWAFIYSTPAPRHQKKTAPLFIRPSLSAMHLIMCTTRRLVTGAWTWAHLFVYKSSCIHPLTTHTHRQVEERRNDPWPPRRAVRLDALR